MGTSHRHKAGPIGAPNWGTASAAVTTIANNETAATELENNPSINMPQEVVARRQSVYSRRIRHQYHKAVRFLVRAAGGRDKVSSGQSRAVGRAGVVWAIGIANAFQEIAEQGLWTWLTRKGISQGERKSCREILTIIEDFVKDYFAGLDETAASEALEHVMDKVEQKAQGDSEQLEITFNTIVNHDEIKDLLDDFFGMYIYSHLSQDFKEKLEKDKSMKIADDTMVEIKELILDDVHRGVAGRSAERVDWKGPDGENFIKREFNRIIQILTNNED